MIRHSILKFVIVLFIITIVAINAAFYLEHERRTKAAMYYTFERFVLGIRVKANSGEDRINLLKDMGLKYADLPNDEIRKEGEKILYDSYCDMILYEGKLFFVPREAQSQERISLVEGSETEDQYEAQQTTYVTALENTQKIAFGDFWVLLFTINGINLSFFTLLLSKLIELRKLKNQIASAGDQKIFTPIATRNQDELGAIAAAFNSTMIKIDAVKEARALFLRNILHELRTPVMKGKLIANLTQDKELKEQLKQIFTRQEVVLNEIVKIEKFSSNDWKLVCHEYRLIDLIDHAKDFLFRDTSRLVVNAKDDALIVSVDFELFTTAIKNLLDNALKYSKDEVLIDFYERKFSISSAGEPIASDRLDFTRAFNRKSETSGSGLGLGIYIANQIITKHNFVLAYEYKDHRNVFIIKF